MTVYTQAQIDFLRSQPREALIAAGIDPTMLNSPAMGASYTPQIPASMVINGGAYASPVAAAAAATPAALPMIPPAVGMTIAAAVAFLRQFAPHIIGTVLGMLAMMGLSEDDEGTPLPDWLEKIIYTILPGQQAALGEYAPGLGDIGGKVLHRWMASGRAEFAKVMHPTATGFTIRTWVYSPKRGWHPIRRVRNIVIGGKELRIAAALGHRRRVGKRRILQIIARPRAMARPRYYRRRR